MKKKTTEMPGPVPVHGQILPPNVLFIFVWSLFVCLFPTNIQVLEIACLVMENECEREKEKEKEQA